MNAIVSREPREMTIEIKFIVRNVRAESFDDARMEAHAFAAKQLRWKEALRSYASREVDGSYTVEFR